MSALITDHSPAWQDEDQAELRKLARAFFRAEITPHQARWDEQHHVDRKIWNKVGDAGLLLLDVPEEYGGGGGTFGHEAVIAQELAHAHDTALGHMIHSTIVSHYILAFGSEEQKKTWLPRLATGESVIGIAMTEPGTGSDLQRVSTTAKRDGDHYLVNGSKTFISNATHMDLLVLVARTSSAKGAKGISLIVLELDALQGFERGRVLHKIGQHGQDTRELSFTDVRVPVTNLLGEEEGQGFYQLMQQLPRERLIIGVSAVAAAEAALLETIAYTKERTAFGQPIFDFQNTRFELASLTTKTLAARAFIDECIAKVEAGTLDPATASMAKLLGSEVQGEVVDRCLQLFGGYGYMTEYPIARMYASARVQRIYGGTSEIMRELIGRAL